MKLVQRLLGDVHVMDTLEKETDTAFDEAYYQQGSERGTQYSDYLENAPKNRTYFEIAETIYRLFKPKRTLEIGCAIGVIVNHLESFDVEAHGTDLSDWAVKNRLSPNVIKPDGVKLPYEDDYFDVVYSVHALEHITTPDKDAVLAEISRVCKSVQWHMMPMLESGPYVGDRFGHLLNLRSDPTHNLLHEHEWWAAQFAKQGWDDTGYKISVVHDNDHFELSDCQILATKGEIPADIARSVSAHNHASARALSLSLRGKPGPGLDVWVNKLRNPS